MTPKIPLTNRLYRIATVSLLLLIAVVTVLTAGCTGGTDETANSLSSEVSYTGSNVEKVELIHFYSESRCASCVILGDLTEEAVNTSYAQELQSGRKGKAGKTKT